LLSVDNSSSGALNAAGEENLSGAEIGHALHDFNLSRKAMRMRRSAPNLSARHLR
jgi:hypothetical protein